MDLSTLSFAQLLGLTNFENVVIGLVVILALLFRFNLSARSVFRSPFELFVAVLLIFLGLNIFISFINIGSSAGFFIYRDFEGQEASRVEALSRILNATAGFVSSTITLSSLLFVKKIRSIGENTLSFVFDFYKFFGIVYLFIYLQSLVGTTLTSVFISTDTLADLSGQTAEVISDNNLTNISGYFFAVITSIFFIFIKNIISPFSTKSSDTDEIDDTQGSHEDGSGELDR
jgi:hypothetical protein